MLRNSHFEDPDYNDIFYLDVIKTVDYISTGKKMVHSDLLERWALLDENLGVENYHHEISVKVVKLFSKK